MSTPEETKHVARSFYEAYNGDDLQGAFDAYISQDLVNHVGDFSAFHGPARRQVAGPLR